MLIIMTIEFHEARARVDELIDAVHQGREVIVTLLGEPFGTMRLYGAEDLVPSRAWVEGVVRRSLDRLEMRILDPRPLPLWLVN